MRIFSGGEHTRRSFLAGSAVGAASALAGCFAANDDSRRVGVTVIDHTDESLDVRVRVTSDEEFVAEQHLDLGPTDPDGSSTMTNTHVLVTDLEEGSDLTTEITVDETRTESVRFTLDCPVDDRWTGDGVAFRVRNEYIETSDGCTPAEP